MPVVYGGYTCILYGGPVAGLGTSYGLFHVIAGVSLCCTIIEHVHCCSDPALGSDTLQIISCYYEDSSIQEKSYSYTV